jgi:hypothetical protein
MWAYSRTGRSLPAASQLSGLNTSDVCKYKKYFTISITITFHSLGNSGKQVKIKFTLEQITKPQRGSRALLFL